jgi:hypothetical protein
MIKAEDIEQTAWEMRRWWTDNLWSGGDALGRALARSREARFAQEYPGTPQVPGSYFIGLDPALPGQNFGVLMRVASSASDLTFLGFVDWRRELGTEYRFAVPNKQNPLGIYNGSEALPFLRHRSARVLRPLGTPIQRVFWDERRQEPVVHNISQIEWDSAVSKDVFKVPPVDFSVDDTVYLINTDRVQLSQLADDIARISKRTLSGTPWFKNQYVNLSSWSTTGIDYSAATFEQMARKVRAIMPEPGPTELNKGVRFRTTKWGGISENPFFVYPQQHVTVLG